MNTTATEPATQLEFPVVAGYTKAKGVYAALTEPYQPHERGPYIQSIITMFVKWNEDAMALDKHDEQPGFERLEATDIAYVDNGSLHDVNYKGIPLSKKRIAELPPIERMQSRRQCLEYGRVQCSPLETPFITTEQRKHIQSMFPVADYPHAHIIHIKLNPPRNKGYDSLVVIEPDTTASMMLTHYVMQSVKEEAA